MINEFNEENKDDLIIAYIDNELDDFTKNKVEDYINTNQNAKDIYEKLKKIKEDFSDSHSNLGDAHFANRTINMIENWKLTKNNTSSFAKFFDFLKRPIFKFSGLFKAHLLCKIIL